MTNPSNTSQSISDRPAPTNRRDSQSEDNDKGQDHKTAGPIFPEQHLDIQAWPDTVLDELGHDPRSHYAERFWVSIIGPSCYLALRRMVEQLERQPNGFRLSTIELALELGLGAKGGRHGPLWRSVERMCHFGVAHRQGPTLAVRRRLPPLSSRQVRRMPSHLVSAHEQWQAERLALKQRRTIAVPPRQVAAITTPTTGGQAA